MHPVTGQLLLSLTNRSAFRMIYTGGNATIQFVGCGGRAFCGMYLGVRSITGRQLRDVRRILQDAESLHPVPLASAIGWDVTATGSGTTYRSASNCGVVCGLYMAPIGSSNVGMSATPTAWDTSQVQNGTSDNGLGASLLVLIIIVSVVAACALLVLFYVLCRKPTQNLLLHQATSPSFEEIASKGEEGSFSKKGERSLVMVPTHSDVD